MVKIYYIYGEPDHHIYASKIITFMVSHLLHLWLIVITFMVGITFIVDFYYIYGCFSFMGDTYLGVRT